MRARVRRRLGDLPGMHEDLRRAVVADPDTDWIRRELAET
ncbi:tetratricopeptide repeat protein [Streptomyces sp. Ag109_O5-1]|nr:tetratricopeptide repeat protein [Streptomyces sp. Ag109_O5-1]RPE43053.1 tetratricopeptide repeat protein [Streptomyces sp. Ag109_O5-1]